MYHQPLCCKYQKKVLESDFKYFNRCLNFFLRIYNLKQENDPRVNYLGRRSVIFWSSAVLFWISDIIFCEIWLKIGFPYLHSLFHVVMCIACCNAIGKPKFLFKISPLDGKTADFAIFLESLLIVRY